MDVVRALVVKNYFLSRLLFFIFVVFFTVAYRLHSYYFNNLYFLKTLTCTVALCFFATIHQRHHLLFVYYRNFVVFAKSNVA